MELLFSIKSGSVPLYVPGFAYGHSSSALTLGQIYHPLPHIASLMPGYWNGQAIEWNNLFKLLSLGLTQLVLFAFLQQMRLNKLFSLLFSFITVYNLRLLDLYRHGAPLEAYTGHLILCAIIGLYFIRPTKWIGPLCIIATAYLLVCSGHPEEMYYGLIGTGLFAGVAPFYLSAMLHNRQIDLKLAIRFWMNIGLFLCLGILLSTAYILPFYFEFISDNVQRVVQDYAFADKMRDSFVGTINNFFLPLRSRPLEAFGGSSLTLIAFILPTLLFSKIKIPRAVWVVWGLLMFVFLHMQGSRTPIHRLTWEYLPLASSIRDPGRISIILPFFTMLLLAWVVQVETESLRLRQAVLAVKPITILAFFSLLLIIIYYLFYAAVYYYSPLKMFPEFFSYPAGRLDDVPYFFIELLTIIIGAALLICVAFYGMRTDKVRKIGLLLAVLTLVQSGIVLHYRTTAWIDKKYSSPTLKEMQMQKKTKLDYLYYQGAGLYSSSAMTQLQRSFVEPFLGKIYTQIIPVASQDDAYKKMQRNRLPQQLFIEGYSMERADAITEGARLMREGRIELIYSSFNRIEFHVVSDAPAMLGISYPYTGKWRAWVNGKMVNVYRGNGASQAVEIPKGESIIEFRYWSPASFLGMVISCTTFALIGLYICVRARNGLAKFVGIFFMVIISTGCFMLWYNSLYNGDDLETQYSWTFSPPPATPNMAYGKKNWLSSCTIFTSWVAREHELNRSRLVDGDRRPDFGFTTRLCDSPAWFLDLYRSEDIKTILLFESNLNPSVNTRPLTVSMSLDGTKWQPVASVVSAATNIEPIRIVFGEPETTRFIRIEAKGKCSLSFDEVEVYGSSYGE